MNAVFFFDWDGTIANSMNLCIAEIRLALNRMNLPVPPESVLRQCNGPTYQESVAIVNVPPERGEEYCAVRLQAELELCAQESRLYPGIRDMLLRLKEHATLCVVTNGLEEYLQLSLQTFGLADVFDHTATYRPGRTKPQALAELIEALHPDRCAMIGDRVGDIRAGNLCSIPTVAACYGFGTPEEWAEANLQAESVEALEKILLDMLA